MILDKIINQTSKDLNEIMSNVPFDTLVKSFSKRQDPPINMQKVLKRNPLSKTYNVICEIKKASPSKGIIKENFNPLKIAKAYDKSGAICMSVLTEEHFFQGSLSYLKEIRKITKTPLLRKDFIIDKYQIAQAYINGADMILLIAKVLDVKVMQELFDYTLSLGMEVLVEVHNKDDVYKALEINSNIIGVNHRNLDDFSMNMNLSKELMQIIPKEKIIVAESGINSNETLKYLDSIGVDAFLIGEHFMRESTIEEYVAKFISKKQQ